MHTLATRTSGVRRRGGAVGIVLVVVLLVIAVAAILWGARSKAPPIAQHVRADLQRRIGVEVAEVTRRVLAERSGPVAVFTLIPQKSGPYADQLAALTAALTKHGIEVKVFTPRAIGLRNDAPYMRGYELVLERCTPAVLVALVHGGVDIGEAMPRLCEFMDGDGRLVLLGDLSRTEGPFVDWIRQGKAVAVARHTGALQHLAPEARTLDPRTTPQQYLDRYYTILTGENIDKKLRVRPRAIRALRRASGTV